MLLCATMLGSAVPGSAATEGLRPLEGLVALGGNWQMGETILSDGSGDIFALSNDCAASFVLEADVEFIRRTGAASLVFLSGDDPARGSYVANIDADHNNARIFRFEARGGATTKGEFNLTEEMRNKSTYHLRVEVDNGSMIYFLDDQPVVTIYESDATKFGTRLGLLTYNTGIKYTNVRWMPLDADAPAIERIAGTDTLFAGQNNMQERLPFDTDSLELKIAPKSGTTLTVSSKGIGGNHPAVVHSGEQVTLSNITESFELIITATAGNTFRHYVINYTLEADPDTLYNEQWRPQLHFTPLVNWLNDPNGLVYDPSDGNWHLFFQYNPYGLNIGNQVWGHAVSDDLMHWKELPIAIPQDYLGAVFSGSAVVDENNTTGFFTDNLPGESKLVALFTCDGGDTTHGVEKQCIAYSKDHGLTWIRPNLEDHGFENPVLSNQGDKYGRDFRDPKIFWYDNRWFMVVAGGRARLFVSDDLIHWTQACDMGFDSECPDFYPLAVDGDENNIKWVYTASGKWYVVGRLEKVAGSDSRYQFIPEGERIKYNGGDEVYATQSFYNDGTGLGRRIGVSWIQDWSADTLAGKTWNGAMSVPYEQTLRTVNGKILLISNPVAEVDAMRSEKILNLIEPTAADAQTAILQNPGSAYDMQITFQPGANAKVAFALRSNGKIKTEVIYDRGENVLRVIRARSSAAGGSIRTGTMEMPLYPDKEGNITLRILMDTTLIEVFGNDGEAACAGMIFPSGDCINSDLDISGDVEIYSLEMWRMTSIWHKDDVILPEPGVYFDAPAAITLGAPVEVTAYQIDSSGNRVDARVTWGDVDPELVKVISKKDGLLVLQGRKEGTVTLFASVGSERKELTLPVADPAFISNLKGWSSKGDWYNDENGLSLSGSNGDSFTFSDYNSSGSFVYSGEARFNGSDGCLGLVFGVTNPENPSSGTWYGANIDTHGAQPVLKLFCNTHGQQTWAEMYTFDQNADVWKLEVEYTEQGQLIYRVNGQTVSHAVGHLPAGRLGLVSWNGGGSFNQVFYSSEQDAAAAKTVEEMIAALGEITSAEQSEQVEATRSAYDGLNYVQQGMVENYECLLVAEAALNDILNPFAMGDVDFSGSVDVADIMKLKALIMADQWSDEELAVGDMDTSKSLDVGDIMAIKNRIMSK